MKTYLSEQQIRLVGRVWEIRRYLKMAQQRLTTDVSLLTFLSQQTGHVAHTNRGLMLDGDATYVSHTPKPNPLLLQSPQKTPDPRLIPFPSKK